MEFCVVGDLQKAGLNFIKIDQAVSELLEFEICPLLLMGPLADTKS